MRNEFNLIEIVNKLKESLPSGEFNALHEPYFNGNEWAYVKECLDTGWVSSVGKFVDQFEKTLAEFTGAKYAVAVVNGTAALHASLMVLGVKPGDEILVPALTFIATVNAISYCGAVPHFVDCEFRTMGVDPYKLKDYLSEVAEIRGGECFNKVTGRRMKALVAMHTFGHPVDLEPLLAVCEQFKLLLVEDAAESLGSYYKSNHVGNWGVLAAFSFNGNKIMTTGGGGAITTNDLFLAKQLKHLTTTAKVPHKWEFIHDQIGYNYRMPNINAALGCAQLEQIPQFLQSKRALAKHYQDVFQTMDGVECFKEANFASSNYWLNVLLLDEEKADQRDDLLELTNEQGIMTRPIWALINKLDMYKECPKMDLSVAESLSRRVVNIPSSVRLGESYEK